jgi:hypothetical protein
MYQSTLEREAMFDAELKKYADEKAAAGKATAPAAPAAKVPAKAPVKAPVKK